MEEDRTPSFQMAALGVLLTSAAPRPGNPRFGGGLSSSRFPTDFNSPQCHTFEALAALAPTMQPQTVYDISA